MGVLNVGSFADFNSQIMAGSSALSALPNASSEAPLPQLGRAKWLTKTDGFFITHRIHGTGIFTYIYHENQPFM